MSLSAREISLVVAELSSLEGARIRRIHQPDAHTLLLRTRYAILLISCHPLACRLHLVEQLGERIAAGDFCQLSRRRLEGKRLAGIEQPGGDRCVRLRFESNPELSLLAELTGRHANLLLLEEETIRGSLLPNRSHRRQLLPGRPYQPLRPAPPREPAAPRFDAQHPSAAVAALYGPLLEAWRVDQLRQAVTEPLRQQWRAKRRLVKNLRRDRAAHEAALAGQRAGDLLLAQLHLVPTRSDRVDLPDLFHEGDGPPPLVEIPLDPRLSPTDNAQRHYRRASKARRGIAALDARIPEVEAEVARLEEALQTLEQTDPAELARLAAEATVSPPPRGRKTRSKARRREPYHRFEAAGGEEILVGRSAADNHRLTFSVARGRDAWLHARDLPGSHVVLRLAGGGDPPHESLLDAACLAKHYSDARSAAHADIHWTLRKHVRSGKVAGQVYLSQSHTLRVSDDPQRLQRLRESRSEAARLLHGVARLPAD